MSQSGTGPSGSSMQSLSAPASCASTPRGAVSATIAASNAADMTHHRMRRNARVRQDEPGSPARDE